jgi:acyl-CoA thioester hydrolase
MSRPNVHVTRTAVRYHETDQMQVVHHSQYVNYFELGRTEMMRESGLDYADMERRGALLAVVEVGLRYVKPARFGDDLLIETRLTEVERVRVRFEYSVLRAPRAAGEAAELLCRGHTLLACVDRGLAPRRIPEEDRVRMIGLVAGEE